VGSTIDVLPFRSAGKWFAIDHAHVDRITRAGRVSSLRCCGEAVVGVTAHAGAAIAVIDLGRLFGGVAGTVASRHVIVRHEDLRVAILAETAREVVPLSQADGELIEVQQLRTLLAGAPGMIR